MFVGPSGVSPSRMDDPENCVGTHEIPTINRRAVVGRIALQFERIDRCDAAIHPGRGSPIQFRLVKIDSFLELRRCSRWFELGMQPPGPVPATPLPVVIVGGIQRVIIGDIVKGAFDAWTATGDDCRQTRKRIGRFRGRSIAVVKAPTSNLRIRPPCFVVEAFIVEHALLSVMLITVAGYS